MPSMPPLDESRQPALAAGVRLRTDPLNGKPLLLYPEGVSELEETAAAILRLCEPPRTITQIVETLSESYDAPPNQIARDVNECLGALAARGLITFFPER
jgi:pyrroloquinoline quinone biosynthesis protein D